MIRIDKKFAYIFVILTATMLLITGSFLIFKSSAYLSRDKIVTTRPNKNTEISVVNEKIELTDELKNNLKQLIPKSTCNEDLLYSQFNGGFYLGLNNDESPEDCSNIKVYTKDYNWQSSSDEILLYSYVLLFDGINYGKTYQNLVVPSSKIESLSENYFIGYGGKYKFTFAKVNNDYVYTSTSYINS